VLLTRGLLLTLEGIDGCGKSTQIGILEKRLHDSGISYITVREPGGTAVGENIRQVLLDNNYSPSLQAEMFLYMAARSELTEQVILPALLAGKIVLCDRFTDSTLAYQGYGGGANLSLIRYLNSHATGGISPDLTILLDLSVEEAAGRRGAMADRMESKDFWYHQRVRGGYIEIANEEEQRVKIVDASDDMESQGRIIWNLVRELIAGHTLARGTNEF